MAPSRTNESATAVPGPSKKSPHKKSRNHPYSKRARRPTDDDALPGVQKLKSALRQTKRLLSKDNLAADVRVETERRLKALEADLACAEQSRKERHYATKYHKVKFFERRKVVRKINQTKRSIAELEGKEKMKLESTLADLRVDLNYVLHFPKTERYVSLFPPEVRSSGPSAAPLDDNEERSKVREMIRQQMGRGELNAQPEDELGRPGRKDKQLTSGRRTADVAASTRLQTQADDVVGDDFFGDDGEEDSLQSDDASDP